MTYLFIGGPADGKRIEVPRGTITWEAEGRPYLAIDCAAKGSKQPEIFFMLVGCTPADAATRYRELCSAQNNTKPWPTA